MQNNKLKKESKKPDLKTISLKNSIPLHLSKEILDKIGYLCQEIEEVEWSGVLFYSVEGSIENYDTVEFKVEDIFLMDKGSATYTAFDMDESLIEYRMNNPKSLSWKVGLIHSHNNMKTFFSATDNSELNDTSEFHNYYLSLIVNNRSEMVAKVAFRGEIPGFTCKNEIGEDWTLRLANKREILFTFDCDIIREVPNYSIGQGFIARTKEVIKMAATKALAKKSKAKFTPTFKPNYQGNIDATDDVFFNANDKRPSLSVEDFTRVLLRFGVDDIKGDKLDDALDDIQISNIDVAEYTNKLVTVYPAVFEKYWDVLGEVNTTMFIITTEEVIDTLNEYEGLFEIVGPLATGLELMLTKMAITDG